MRKAQFLQKLDEVSLLIEKGSYEEAAEHADELDLELLTDPRQLQNIAKAYEKCRRYIDAEDILLQARDYAPKSLEIVSHLCKVSIKAGELEEAHKYLADFEKMAPHDLQRHALKFRIALAEKAPDEDLISILEAYHAEEPDDRYMYALAELYARTGKTEQAVELCNEIELWFDSGRYLDQARELRARLGGVGLDFDEIMKYAEQEEVDGKSAGEENAYDMEDADAEKEDAAAESVYTEQDTAEKSEEDLLEGIPEIEFDIPGTPAYTNTVYSQPKPMGSYVLDDGRADAAAGEAAGETAEDEIRIDETVFEETEDIEAEEITEEKETAETSEASEAADEAGYTAGSAEEAAATAGIKEETEEPAGTAEAAEEPAGTAAEIAEAIGAAAVIGKTASAGIEISETVIDEEEPAVENGPVVENEMESDTEGAKALRERTEKSMDIDGWNHIDFPDDDDSENVEIAEEVLGQQAVVSVSSSSFDIPDEIEFEWGASAEGDVLKPSEAAEARETPEKAETVPAAENEKTSEVGESAGPSAAEPADREKEAGPAGAEEPDKGETAETEEPDKGEPAETEEPDEGETAEAEKNDGPEETVSAAGKAPAASSFEIPMPSDEEISGPAALEENEEIEFPASEAVTGEEKAETFADEPIFDVGSAVDNELAKRKSVRALFGNIPIAPDARDGLWHFIVYSEEEQLALECAREEIKEIGDENENCPEKMLKISALRIKDASIVNSLDHFLGNIVIVENCAALSDAQLRDFTKILDKDDRSLLVIFADTKDNVISMLQREPGLSECFTGIFEGKRYTPQDLVKEARDYLFTEAAKLSAEAEKCVYEEGRRLIQAGRGFYRTDIIDYVSKALSIADKGGFLGMMGGKCDKEGYLIITEKHFKKVNK